MHKESCLCNARMYALFERCFENFQVFWDELDNGVKKWLNLTLELWDRSGIWVLSLWNNQSWENKSLELQKEWFWSWDKREKEGNFKVRKWTLNLDLGEEIKFEMELNLKFEIRMKFGFWEIQMESDK